MFGLSSISWNYEKENFQSNIIKGNVDTIDKAFLVFIFEEHGNVSHEKFFANVVATHADKKCDVALVEEPKHLKAESLNKSLKEKSPIKAASLVAMESFGWDHPQKELWLNEIHTKEKELQESVKIVSQEKQAQAIQKIKAFATLTAYHNTLHPNEKINPAYHMDEILKGSNKQLISKLQIAATEVIEKEKKELVFRTFPIRQDSLEESIQSLASIITKKNELSSKKAKIFISFGEHHGITSKENPFYNTVTNFFDRISTQYTFVALHPEKINPEVSIQTQNTTSSQSTIFSIAEAILQYL